jgi:C4-type Zn-finger protein
MPALAEILSTKPSRLPPRSADRPVCTICMDSMVAAEASAFVSDDVISYLWTCDNCGYGFVTKHSTKAIVCN